VGIPWTAGILARIFSSLPVKTSHDAGKDARGPKD